MAERYTAQTRAAAGISAFTGNMISPMNPAESPPAAVQIRPMHRRPSLTVVIAIAAAVAAGGWTLRYGVRDNLIPRNFGVVESGQIYRSGRLSIAQLEAKIKEHNIKTIVDLGAFGTDSTMERLQQKTADALGVRRVRFGLQGDATGDPQDYVGALKIITDPANQPVLVHCAAGAQRTSACVMLYRKGWQGVGFEQSLDEAKDFKHDPTDNPHLLKYLAEHGDAILRQATQP